MIGFTGAFGSGCTTATKHLRDQRAFTRRSLSDALRSQFENDVGAKADEAPREDLQRFGDELRKAGGTGVLVDLALQSEPDTEEEVEFVVIDSIRNTGEVAVLRDLFGFRFTLFGVLADADARWNRIGTPEYLDLGRTQDDFLRDDQRDRNEEVEHGQQVELCLDQADVFISNPGDVNVGDFRDKVAAFADLVTKKTTRHATSDEINMHMAFSAAHSSKCLKRNVGAIIVDPRGEPVSLGFNENPLGTNPCVEEPAYDNGCFRDIVRNRHFALLAEQGASCPSCGERLPVIEGPPWRCPSCSDKNAKTNLEAFFFPDRAMNWCTAVHAEDRAVLAAGTRARKGTMFATTFPCFQCAEKMIQAGIAEVCFTEAYPDIYSADRLDLAGVTFRQFEGVRSSVFERVFPRVKT